MTRRRPWRPHLSPRLLRRIAREQAIETDRELRAAAKEIPHA